MPNPHNVGVAAGLELDSSLRDAVGDRTAKAFERAFGYRTVHDVLLHVPRRYNHRGELTDLRRLTEGEHVTVLARIAEINTRPMRNRRGTLTEVVVTDGSGRLTVTFFRKPYGLKLAPGAVGLFAGKVSRFRGTYQLAHPECLILDGGADDSSTVDSFATEIIPVYPATSALSSWAISKAIRVVLDQMDWSGQEDPIPADIRQRHGLMEMGQAFEAIHRPTDLAATELGKIRIRWSEALALQTVLAVRREAFKNEAALVRAPSPAGILARFDDRLPFTLTKGQQEVGQVIADELAQAHPMHRLLQGEVGSGKTLVAVRAMLAVVDSGGQAALLAPTEVLAAQHARSVRALLGPLAAAGTLEADDVSTKVTLLTGSMSTKARRQALLEIASGEAGIVIGTHALLEDKVSFADLGLVVIDEQHRFGVEQRASLAAKAQIGTRPHVLVMTATPIPRTVAITVFGDLDVSVLKELPAGRAPITSHVVPAREKPAYLERTWERVREEVAAGRQAYVVCPRISSQNDQDVSSQDGQDAHSPPSRTKQSMVAEAPQADPWDLEAEADDDTLPITAAEDLFEYLSQGPLSDLRVAILHGRMPADEKEVVMRRFASTALKSSDDMDGIDVLVATTVIEVGVDVANASVMVIMDADRFGVSQLHQLRGRVGRGGLPGLCLLVTNAPNGSPARERLAAVAATIDGFELSKVDLHTRREGDVLGSSQSGNSSSLRALSLLRDEAIIVAARQEASDIVASDPMLVDHRSLARMVDSLTQPDAAQWLDRS